jgi:hypothetical protein
VPPPDDLSADSLSVSGWGASVQAHGILVVLLLAIGGLYVLTIVHTRDLSAARVQQLAEHQMIMANQDNLGCILLMTAEERRYAPSNPERACDYLRLMRGAQLH